MQLQNNIYRKNFSLVIIFVVLISATLIVALIVGYNLTGKYVESEFNSRKIDVQEQTLKPYNDFFQNKIPEITSYQGFLDSASAANYAQTVFDDYSFVKEIKFFDLTVGSSAKGQKGALQVNVKGGYLFTRHNDGVSGKRSKASGNDHDFKLMAEKFRNFIEEADTTRIPDQDQQYSIFYDVKPYKISYLNIPRRADIKNYKQLLQSDRSGAFYEQDMMTFVLDPKVLRVKNTHHELYREISIQPVVLPQFGL